jgi:hypothetical protein
MIRRSRSILMFPGFLLFLCAPASGWAQDSTPAPSPATPAASSPSTPTAGGKPKKVWTNDDVKSAGVISVIGDPRNQKYSMTRLADAATVAKYKTNLQKLQAQLDEVNKKLQGFTDFSEGKPSPDSGRDVSHGYSRTPVDQQVTKLQDKKKQLLQLIDDLYDSARKDGVESGQLK